MQIPMSHPLVPAATGASSDFLRGRSIPHRGFALVEILLGLVLGGVVLGLAAVVVVSYLRITDKALWIAQTEQDFGRISRLMKTEINEACLVQVSSSPSTTATLPRTPCNPATALPCATSTSGTTLYLLVPTLSSVTVQYNVISYTRTNDKLLRTGPAINTNGSLGTANTTSPVVLIDNLSNLPAGFVPTLNSDCVSATVSLQFSVPNQNATVTHSFQASVGSPSMLY